MGNAFRLAFAAGLLVLSGVPARAASAIPVQDGPRGPRMSEEMMDLGLLAAPQVRDELKLSERQRNKLDDASPEDDFMAILGESQRNRFRQIRLQMRGVDGMLQEPVATRLTISAEQREKLVALAPDGMRMFMPAEERQELLKRALALLTDAQRATYAELTGPAVTIEMGPPGMPGMGPPMFGPGGPGGPGGGPGAPDRALVKEFDKNGDHRLDRAERDAARAKLKEERANGGGRRRMGPPFGGESEEAKPGVTIRPDGVRAETTPLYDPATLRTLFFDFDDADWTAEMGDFYGTDVEVPATLTVDGKRYPNVGVSYRGASSYFTVAETLKRSLNVSVDCADGKQRLLGYKSLNLLNAHEDPTFLHTVLFLDIARRHMPAPKANLVRVVINGENWGVYSNAQQFNREMLAEHFPSAEGARWKVPGNPGARGGLEYTGEDVAQYKQRFEIKSKDSDASWKALIRLCRTLNETPSDSLEAALTPILDIDQALWFLALDCALVNNDGYWTRSSDYNLFLDEKGVFHLIPHDANETFATGGGGPPGMRGPGGRGPGGRDGPPGSDGGEPRGRGPNAEASAAPAAPAAQDGPPPEGERPRDRPRDGGGRRGGGGMRMGGPTLDPLVGLDDAAKPLRSKLLAVPSLRRRYLEHVRAIATEDLDWERSFGPMAQRYADLIRKEVEIDTKKLSSYESFARQLERSPAPKEGEQRRGGTLRDFVEERRAYLLSHPAIKSLDAAREEAAPQPKR